MLYNIVTCYNRDYITGNAPYGIFLVDDIEYANLDDAKNKFIELLREREESNYIEFGWNLEYRFAIVETNNNISFKNKVLDKNIIKRKEEVSLYNEYIILKPSKIITKLLETDYKDEFWNNQLIIYNNIIIF